MKIDYKILERYHLNQCTPEERLLVEQWLDEDLADFESPFSAADEKQKVQNEIWAELNNFIDTEAQSPAASSTPLPSDTVAADLIDIKPKRLISFKQLCIAAAVIVIIGSALVTFKSTHQISDAIFDNSANAQLKYIEKNNYELILGRHASARVNLNTGVFDTSGDMMLIPKKDFLFSFSESSEKKKLKNGETYFVIESPSTGKPIIISKTEMTFLAPTIQNQLKMQFNIS